MTAGEGSPPESLSEETLDDPLLRFAKAQPALTVAGVTTAVFVVKVMFAARLNTEVALGIVAATGPAELVFGLIALLFPAFALFIGVGLAYAAWVRWRSGNRITILGLVAAVTLLLGLATAQLSSIFSFAVGIILGVVVGISIKRLATRVGWGPAGGRHLRTGSGYSLAVAASIPLFLVVLAQPTMWLPPENFRVPDLRADMMGYFIEEDGGWVTVLDETGYLLIRLRDTQITDRRLCTFRYDEPLRTTLWSLFYREPAPLEGCYAASSATGTPRPVPSPSP